MDLVSPIELRHNNDRVNLTATKKGIFHWKPEIRYLSQMFEHRCKEADLREYFQKYREQTRMFSQ